MRPKYSLFEGKEVTGFIFLVSLQSLDYFYFFLFRSDIHLSAFQSDIFPTNVAQSNLFLHDRFFSFQQFCDVNNLMIEPLFFKESEGFGEDEQVYKITRQPFYYYFPFDSSIIQNKTLVIIFLLPYLLTSCNQNNHLFPPYLAQPFQYFAYLYPHFLKIFCLNVKTFP